MNDKRKSFNLIMLLSSFSVTCALAYAQHWGLICGIISMAFFYKAYKDCDKKGGERK